MPRRMPERSNDITVYMVLNDYRTGAGRARQFRIDRSEHVEMFPDARPQEEGTAATDRRCMRSAGRAEPRCGPLGPTTPRPNAGAVARAAVWRGRRGALPAQSHFCSPQCLPRNKLRRSRRRPIVEEIIVLIVFSLMH